MSLDLHMHSNISLDGEFSPARLASLCRSSGLTLAALTDHNSVRGQREFLKNVGELEIAAITGIELDCTLKGVDLHLLGYGIDVTDPRYRELEEEILSQKRETSQKRMEILKNMGVWFDEDTVLASARDGIVVGEMIAAAALRDARNDGNPLLLPYRMGESRGDNPLVNFFWDFCSQGKPAYLPIRYPSFEEALALIHATGGFASVAHPVNTIGRREDLIRYIADCGAEGLEVYSSYHTQDDIVYYRLQAERFGFMPTAGSDFHGMTKPAVHLADTTGLTQEEEKRLKEAFYRLLTL